MKNNIAIMIVLFSCVGFSANVYSMQQRRDYNNFNIKHHAKMAQFENKAAHLLNQIKMFEADVKVLFSNPKKSAAVQQNKCASCPTLCAKRNQNTFMRLNALKNANYFSSKEFDALNEKLSEQWYDIDYLNLATQEEIGLYEAKCDLLRDAIAKGMNAGYIQETSPDLGTIANTLRNEILRIKRGELE